MNITDNDCSRILSNLAPVLTQKDITKQYKVDVVRKTSKQRMRQQLIDRRTNNRSSRKQHPETDRECVKWNHRQPSKHQETTTMINAFKTIIVPKRGTLESFGCLAADTWEHSPSQLEIKFVLQLDSLHKRQEAQYNDFFSTEMLFVFCSRSYWTKTVRDSFIISSRSMVDGSFSYSCSAWIFVGGHFDDRLMNAIVPTWWGVGIISLWKSDFLFSAWLCASELAVDDLNVRSPVMMSTQRKQHWKEG